MGHIYHRHNARTNAESVRNEQQADQFAARVMQRTPLPPLGVLIFFMADAGWSGFSGSDRHPLSGKRVRALADHVDTRGLASQLREFGKLLEDPEEAWKNLTEYLSEEISGAKLGASDFAD